MSTTSWAEKSTPISGKLENGLRYTILPLHQQKNRLDIRVKVHAGAVDEQTHQAGVAHMVEHMVFRATKDYPQGIMPYLHENQWVRAKHYNAVTTQDSTTYMFVPPPQFGLKNTLNVIHQMLFQAQFKAEDLEKERQIILEEWRGNQGVASRMNFQRTQSVRINSRYARHQPIGTADNIQQLPASELQHFYQTWYVPNNIHLMIIGDINIDDAKHLIEQQFGNIPSQKLAERDYYDPILEQKIRFHQLHDEQSGVSQIAYIFRFDEQENRINTEQARKQRLIDRLALYWLEYRLKLQQGSMKNKQVKSLVVRKSDIGKNTVALGFFSSVEKTAHRAGLQYILLEINRLQQFPITDDELQRLKNTVQQQLNRAKNHQEDRDFEQWLQVMNNTLFSEKSYLTQQDIAQRTQSLLDEIQRTDIQQRVEQWLKSGDQIVQYQAPHQHRVADLSLEEFQQIQEDIAKKTLSAPQFAQAFQAVELPKISSKKGKIVRQIYDKTTSIYDWQLANGDRVVWLKSPIAQNKTYLQAVSKAGFQRQDLYRWQAQIATQIMKQQLPFAWTAEQFSDWKKRYQVNYSWDYDAYQWRFSAHIANQSLAQLLHIYRHTQEIDISEKIFYEIKQQLESTLQQQNVEMQRQQSQISQLRFGRDADDILPNMSQIQALSHEDLQQQWTKIQRTPTTYYIVSNADKTQMQNVIRQYIAPILRQKNSASIAKITANKEQKILYLPSHSEPKHEVQMWIDVPYAWQGQDAMLVSALKSIVSQKLKQSLRDEQLGIYRLSFETRLNSLSQQIESELKFTTSPEKSQQMMAQAEYILANLASLISEQDVKMAKAQLRQQEQERLKHPETWLNRLILSHQHEGDGRYLQQMQTLTEQITLGNLQRLAGQMYDSQRVKIVVRTPLE